MSAPAGPPEIDGYEFLQPLGSGGFADVYQYEQESPRRSVAIKVLRGDDLTPSAVSTFADEANLMAQLSTHPAIVTVHTAGTLADGRPYIVMEHCPRPNLGARFRTEVLPLDEALAIGVQIAGAVETAHRAGVLHRDIKPANVLVTSFGRPALADFGIAATIGTGATGAAIGLSVPWSAPESLDSGWAGVATDVYALGATVYSLLAGRAPFERDEAANDPADQSARIRNDAVPPTGRSDVPASLESVLATAMAKSPQGRYTSALSFARALQKVQRELGLPVTTVDVLDAGPGGSTRSFPGDDSLSVRPLGATTSQSSATGGVTGPARAAAPSTAGPAPTERRAPSGPVYIAPPAMQTGTSPSAARTGPNPARAAAVATDPTGEHTVRRAAVAAPAPDFGPPPPKRKPVWPGVLLDVLLLAAVVAAAAVLLLT